VRFQSNFLSVHPPTSFQITLTKTTATGALDGITVIDHSHVIAGSYCGRLLGELGAQVIKIEPISGEMFRHMRPFVDGQSLLYSFVNANKKSVTLNLKAEAGKKIFFELIKRADVFIENYAPGTFDRLGVGYQDQQKVNPKIIYASVTGFGNNGPYKDLVAFDYLIQAMLGLIDANGFPDKRVRIGPAVTDWGSGTFAALCILVALYHRDRTGEGQRIDVSMFDVGSVFLIEHLAYALGSIPVRVGDRFQNDAPSNTYWTRDGQIYVSIYSDSLWRKFLEKIGRPDVLADPRFSSRENRATNVDEVDKIVSDWALKVNSNEAISFLRGLGAACGRVNNVLDILNDPHALARDLFKRIKNDEKMGELLIPGSPLKLSKTPGEVKTAGPLLGTNNKDIYCDMLGYSEDDLKRMKEQNII
jgi:CoA:oxalate CoA-transferase